MHKDQSTPSNRLNFTKRALDRLTLPSEGVAYFYDTDTKGLAMVSARPAGRVFCCTARSKADRSASRSAATRM